MSVDKITKIKEQLNEVDFMADEDSLRADVIMRLKKSNCHNCYKCVRECPANAISILGNQAHIQEPLCIFCGKCYLVCPQDARDMLGDLARVRRMINRGEKVYFSLSSAFSTFFRSTSFKSMGLVLKKLGATRVEETAVGGNRVMEEYLKIIEAGEMKNMISTLCPSSNFLFQKKFPHLVSSLVPVETPLEAHARMMRMAYGKDIRVVGVGPCIAYHKLADISEGGKLIDAYITYEELEQWMQDEGVEITAEEDPDTIPVSNYRGRYLDEVGGMFRALPSRIKYDYKTWEAHGTESIIDMFTGVDSTINKYCINVSSCENNCLGGPIIRLLDRDDFHGKDRWLYRLKEGMGSGEINPSEKVTVNVRKKYSRMDIMEPAPSEEDINYFLSLIGRDAPGSQYDCGGCGYATCRDKAIAVYKGFADPFMCIPHSRDKAEAQSNLLFDYSPSGVIIMDPELNILEVNPVAVQILGVSAAEAKDQNIRTFLGKDFFDRALLLEKEVIRDTIKCEPIKKLLSITFFRVVRHDLIMIVIDDKTELYENYEQERRVRQETLQVTQNVVEKQMRIAQEIASLLGETTAETKLALNRLKNTLVMDEDGWK